MCVRGERVLFTFQRCVLSVSNVFVVVLFEYFDWLLNELKSKNLETDEPETKNGKVDCSSPGRMACNDDRPGKCNVSRSDNPQQSDA